MSLGLGLLALFGLFLLVMLIVAATVWFTFYMFAVYVPAVLLRAVLRLMYPKERHEPPDE